MKQASIPLYISLMERGDSIRLFQIYSSVSGKDGLYRLFADCGTTISQNNIPDAGALLFSSGKNLPGSSPVQA